MATCHSHCSLLATNDDLSVPTYLARLTDERTRLAQLRDPDSPDLDVEASLRLSYDALDAAAQQALSMMSAFPLSFSANLVAAIVPNEPEEILHHLRRRSLVEWDATTTRYSLHDLVRLLASQQEGATSTANSNLPDELAFTYLAIETQQIYREWEAATDADMQTSLAEQYRKTLEALWEHIAPDLRRVARGWIRSGVAPDIETLAMNMFSYIVFKLPTLTFDAQRNIRGLLITVARRGMSDDYYRSYATSPKREPNQKVNSEGILSAVDIYWDTLDEADRQIMRLRWRSDPPVSFREIARQLGPGWAEDTVRQRHHRIINATRKQLRDQNLLDDAEPLS